MRPDDDAHLRDVNAGTVLPMTWPDYKRPALCFICGLLLKVASRVAAHSVSLLLPHVALTLRFSLRFSNRLMKLYFLRHADALPGADDAARPLSPLGRKQARKLGRVLKVAGIEFDAAYSSPLVRAMETAKILLETLGSLSPRKIQAADALLNETAPAQFQLWLKGLPSGEHVLLVGHAPTLTERVCRLLGISNPDRLRLPKGGFACLETEDRRTAALKFFITPKVLGL